MDKSKLEAEKAHAEKEISQLENRQKILLNRIRKEERNARTSRLCKHGAIMEGVFPFTASMDGESLKAFLIDLSRLPGAEETAEKAPKNRPHKLKPVSYGALIHRSGVVRPAGGCCVLVDAMGSYTPQTPCAPEKTEHPLCVYSAFSGLYPPAVDCGGRRKTHSNLSLSHSNYQAERGPFGCRCCRLPERREADK